MQEIRLERSQYQCVISPYAAPVAHIRDGETAMFYTEDAFWGNLTSEDLDPKQLNTYSNPLVGPVYVEGAHPGDALKISILDITPTRDTAVSCIHREFGALQYNRRVKFLNDPLPLKVYLYHYKDGIYSHGNRLSFSPDPFIGTIATAPEIQAPSSNTPFEQGGNMDVPDVKPGNILYLPIQKEGAYLYLGDCHARQGQGEACGAALEIAARVTLKLEVVPGLTLRQPRIESPTELMCIGSARPMEDAARIACYELVQWMIELGWDAMDAYQAITMDSSLYVGNMVDPNYSLVAKVAKELAYRK